MNIEQLSKKIDKYHEENRKREEKGRYENFSLVSIGLAVAVAGLAFSTDSIVSIIVSGVGAGYFCFLSVRAFKKI